MKRTTVYIGVGSNIEPMKNILKALSLLAEYVQVTRVSTFYQTPAIDRPEQDDYLNGVVQIRTEKTPQELHELLHEIEFITGRVRVADKYAPRPIDLDILLFGSVVMDDEHLKLPSRDIDRPFVVAALLELDPDLRLPNTDQLLSSFVDKGPRNFAIAHEMNELLRDAPWM